MGSHPWPARSRRRPADQRDLARDLGDRAAQVPVAAGLGAPLGVGEARFDAQQPPGEEIEVRREAFSAVARPRPSDVDAAGGGGRGPRRRASERSPVTSAAPAADRAPRAPRARRPSPRWPRRGRAPAFCAVRPRCASKFHPVTIPRRRPIPTLVLASARAAHKAARAPLPREKPKSPRFFKSFPVHRHRIARGGRFTNARGDSALRFIMSHWDPASHTKGAVRR